MKSRREIRILDPLYGDMVLNGPIADLSCTPAIQRLREIRLSNIDSLSMPGIANISRYEHSIGTAYLASRIGFSGRLSQSENLVLQAAAMLHDFAITAFGHLVEEALQYVSAPFKHEMKLSMLLQTPGEGELGGINLQLYSGHESGIRPWFERTFGTEAERSLQEIVNALTGKGRYGPCIVGDIDLDNLDNLNRIAFHMGLDVDKGLPIRIAGGIVESNEEGVIFSSETVVLIKNWLELRRNVYSRLMLSRDDFAGKTMLIYATIKAFTREEIGPPIYAWTLTDRMLLQSLLQSKDKDVVRTVQSWLLSDLWPISDLIWMDGKAPQYSTINNFNSFVSDTLDRPCFAYSITDKRTRFLKFRLESGKLIQLGSPPSGWVLGVASRNRSGFSVAENRRLQQVASEFFDTKCLGKASESTLDPLPLFE